MRERRSTFVSGVSDGAIAPFNVSKNIRQSIAARRLEWTLSQCATREQRRSSHGFTRTKVAAKARYAGRMLRWSGPATMLLRHSARSRGPGLGAWERTSAVNRCSINLDGQWGIIDPFAGKGCRHTASFYDTGDGRELISARARNRRFGILDGSSATFRVNGRVAPIRRLFLISLITDTRELLITPSASINADPAAARPPDNFPTKRADSSSKGLSTNPPKKACRGFFSAARWTNRDTRIVSFPFFLSSSFRAPRLLSRALRRRRKRVRQRRGRSVLCRPSGSFSSADHESPRWISTRRGHKGAPTRCSSARSARSAAIADDNHDNFRVRERVGVALRLSGEGIPLPLPPPRLLS